MTTPAHQANLGEGPGFHLLRRTLQPYQEAWEEQLAWVAEMLEHGKGNAVILTEHPPVITLGRGAGSEQLLPLMAGQEEIPIIRTDRGGLATCHLPGQMIAYVLWDLRPRSRQVKAHVERLEETIIQTLDACGIMAQRDPAGRGVWVDGAKIAALGLRVRQGIAYHGLAINRDPDLGCFRRIIPCGLVDRPVTSLAALGCAISRDRLESLFVSAFCQVFQCRSWPANGEIPCR